MRKLFYASFLLLPFASQGQIKIGNNPTTIDPASILELEHPNKALYLPRVSLTSASDITTVPSPKAGMVVYNTNASMPGGTGAYIFDGSAWTCTGGGGPATSGWALSGNTGINSATQFLGTSDINSLAIRSNNVQRAVFRGDGSLAIGNSSPVSPSNLFEIPLQNVGGIVTTGEENQGVNVLASCANGSTLSIGLRSRLNINSSTTIAAARGIQGTINVDGTANGDISGGQYNAVLRTGGALGSTSTLTGIGADAEATGGTAAVTNAFIGGRFSANSANATTARAYGSFNYANNSVSSNIGTVSISNDPGLTKFASFRNALPIGYGAGVIGLNGANGESQYAGHFVSNNSHDAARTLHVSLSPAANTLTTTGNSAPFATSSTLSYAGTESTGNFAGTVGGLLGNATTTSSDYQSIGALLQGTTSGKGLGANNNNAQAIGALSIADYTSTVDAGIDDYGSGSVGAPYTSNKAINGIGVTGAPYSSGFYRMIGGYFRAAGGTVDNGAYHRANLGVVAQGGGNKNQAWRDIIFNDKNIGIVAVNYNTPSANNLALYTNGAIQMKSLTGTGVSLLTIDAVSGNVGSTSGATSGVTLPAGTTAQQPVGPQTGTVRFNTTTHRFEGYTDDTNTSNATYPEAGWVELSTN